MADVDDLDDPNRDLKVVLNVGHGLEATYAQRFQRALAAVLAICEPHDTRPRERRGDADGSRYLRGFVDGQRSIAGAVIAALRTVVPED